MDRTPTGRYTVSEAAGVLGISVEAVRGRVKRRTLKSERADDGTVYVLVSDDRTRPDTDRPNDRTPDQTLMVARLEDEVAFLRDQVRRQQEIIAQQALTMRQLSAPPGPPEEAETVQEGEEPPESTEGSQTGTRRPWWRFW